MRDDAEPESNATRAEQSRSLLTALTMAVSRKASVGGVSDIFLHLVG